MAERGGGRIGKERQWGRWRGYALALRAGLLYLAGAPPTRTPRWRARPTSGVPPACPRGRGGGECSLLPAFLPLAHADAVAASTSSGGGRNRRRRPLPRRWTPQTPATNSSGTAATPAARARFLRLEDRGDDTASPGGRGLERGGAERRRGAATAPATLRSRGRGKSRGLCPGERGEGGRRSRARGAAAATLGRVVRMRGGIRSPAVH